MQTGATVYTYMNSALGNLLLARNDVGLTHIVFQQGRHPMTPDASWRRDDTAFADVIQQLEEYFRGERGEFTLTLAPSGTGFQLRVWQALQAIPCGATATYADIARAIGRPAATRAVGAANGRNPLPIVIPCHRIIGSDGSLTGYGGGLPIKEALLDLERRYCARHDEQLTLA